MWQKDININEIREIRNYWCHQCYLDFIYIENDYEWDLIDNMLESKYKEMER